MEPHDDMHTGDDLDAAIGILISTCIGAAFLCLVAYFWPA